MELHRGLSAGKDLLILLDFDGTLAPLAPTPRAAHMDPVLRRWVRKVSVHPGVHVGVISGRALADVEKRVGVPTLFYGGNHGLELKGPGIHFRHPQISHTRPALEKMASLCREAFGVVPGALVETKTWGVAVHDRRVPEKARKDFRAALKRVKAATRSLPLVWQPGRNVWEALPRVAWDKGHAARMLRKHLGAPVTVAVGDDRTDERMFRAVNRGGISVRVAPIGASAAQYAVPRQADVAGVLETLDAAIRQEAL